MNFVMMLIPLSLFAYFVKLAYDEGQLLSFLGFIFFCLLVYAASDGNLPERPRGPFN